MTDTLKTQSTATSGSRPIASGSGNELIPFFQAGESILLDAHLLHQHLKVGRKFASWIINRIQEYGFVNGVDFFLPQSPNMKDFFDIPVLGNQKNTVDYSKKSNQKRGGDRRSITYLITLDMAKELAMVEKSDRGRQARRYFIEKEKELRAVQQRALGMIQLLPEEPSFFKGIRPQTVNNRKLYPYKEIIHRIGYSTRSGSASLRRRKYPQHFLNVGDKVYITREYALHLLASRRVYANRAVLQATQPLLPLNFNQNKGGTP